MNINHKNYFEIFSLLESFQINIEELSRQYKLLQTQYHPDKFVGASDSARLQALQTTSIINEAFDTLKTPLKRAAYLLSLNNIDAEESVQAHLGSDFLLNQMAQRDKLESIAESEDFEALGQLKSKVSLETDSFFDKFKQCYEAANYVEAKPIYSKLQFLVKLLSEIDSIEETLLGY